MDSAADDDPAAAPPQGPAAPAPIHEGLLLSRKSGQETSRYFVIFPDRLDYFKTHEEYLQQGADTPRGRLVFSDVEKAQVTDGSIVLTTEGEEDGTTTLLPVDDAGLRAWTDAFAQALRPTHEAGEDGAWALRSRVAATQLGRCEGWGSVEKKSGLVRRYFVLLGDGLAYYESERAMKERKVPQGSLIFSDIVRFEAAGGKLSVHVVDSKKPIVIHIEDGGDFDMWVCSFRRVLGPRLGDAFAADGEAPLCEGTFDMEAGGSPAGTKLVRLFTDRLEHAVPGESGGKDRRSISVGSIKDVEVTDGGLLLDIEGVGSMGLQASPGVDISEWTTALAKVCGNGTPGGQDADPSGPAPEALDHAGGPHTRAVADGVKDGNAVEVLYQGMVCLSETGRSPETHHVIMCTDRFQYFASLGTTSSGARLQQVLAASVRHIVVRDDGFQIVLDDRIVEFQGVAASQMDDWVQALRGIVSWGRSQRMSGSSKDPFTGARRGSLKSSDGEAGQSSVNVTSAGSAQAQQWASVLAPPESPPRNRVSFVDTCSDDGAPQCAARGGPQAPDAEGPAGLSPDRKGRSSSTPSTPRFRFIVPRCGRIPPPTRYHRSPEPRKKNDQESIIERRHLRVEGSVGQKESFRVNTHKDSFEALKLMHGKEAVFLWQPARPHVDPVVAEKLTACGRPDQNGRAAAAASAEHIAGKITGDTSTRVFRQLSPRGDRSCGSQDCAWAKITISEDSWSAPRYTPRAPSPRAQVPVLTAKVNEANRAQPPKKGGFYGKITDSGREEMCARRANSQPLLIGKITDPGRSMQGWAKQSPRGDSLRKYQAIAGGKYTTSTI